MQPAKSARLKISSALSSLGFWGSTTQHRECIKAHPQPAQQPRKSGVRAVVEGESIHTEPCGAPQGTTIEVRQLFYNVPARYKFLKSPATEGRRVLELVTDMAAAHPHIAFTLVRDGKLSFLLKVVAVCVIRCC